MDTNYCEFVVEQLQAKGIGFDTGLSDAEVEAVQGKFGFVFPPDLRLFLQTALPVYKPPRTGTSSYPLFPNWRSGAEEDLWRRLHQPYEGLCFDIGNGFWWKEWGPRPESKEDAFALMREKLNQAPTLIPICGHRYMPDSPTLSGNPVYSIHQRDIIYYGFDLPSYLVNEFKIDRFYERPKKPRRIEFWASMPLMWRAEWG